MPIHYCRIVCEKQVAPKRCRPLKRRRPLKGGQNGTLKVIWNDILTILSYIREWVHKCLFNKTDIVFWIFYAKCERHSRSKLLNREKEHWLTRLTSLAYDVSKTQSPYKAMLWIQISMSFCSILKEKKYYFI